MKITCVAKGLNNQLLIKIATNTNVAIIFLHCVKMSFPHFYKMNPPSIDIVQLNCTITLSNYISMGNIMRHVSYSAARANLAATMDEVVNDRMPTIITRQNGNNCILMSYDEFTSLEETARLYRSPANAKHLLRSLEQINNGQLQEHDLQGE